MKRLGWSVTLSIVAAIGCGKVSSAIDAGADAGGDAGAELDSGVDAGAVVDAGGPVACASYAGCGSYDDRTAPGADRTVSFTCCSYSPPCMKIQVGQAVTFSGSFSSHPLESATSCPGNPITNVSGGSSTQVTFSTAGFYGYFCGFHGGSDGAGMAGAIQVVP